MKIINPYPKQQIIALSLGMVGFVGTLILTLNLIFKWEQDLFSIGILPVLLFNFYQYRELKKNNIKYSKDAISWKIGSMEERKQLRLETPAPEFNANWKGISIKNGEELIDISLDSVWKKDRKRILEALDAFYNA